VSLQGECDISTLKECVTVIVVEDDHTCVGTAPVQRSIASIGKRYGHNTSNLVEVMNKWMLEERRMCVLDLLHSLWSKCMDLHFRQLQEAKTEDEKGAILTKYTTKLLQESMDHALV